MWAFHRNCCAVDLGGARVQKRGLSPGKGGPRRHHVVHKEPSTLGPESGGKGILGKLQTLG